MKFKLIAYSELLLGLFQVIYGGTLSFIVIPKLSILYSEFNLPISVLQKYGISVIIILLGLINIFFTFKILKSQGAIKEKYLKSGAIYLLINFILTGIAGAISVLSIINPIYQMTSQLQ
jgi:hypothetical protein